MRKFQLPWSGVQGAGKACDTGGEKLGNKVRKMCPVTDQAEKKQTGMKNTEGQA